MKKQLPSFAAGMLTMALISGLAASALAASGSFTITVDPINVQVNGEVFQPKDVTGADVPVFVYNGTTYAPLRALAEAYGLEVGYDSQTNMATVTGDVAASVDTTAPSPDTTASVNDFSDWTAEEEAAYQEFKGLWEVEEGPTSYVSNGKNYVGYIVRCSLSTPSDAEAISAYHAEHPNYIHRYVLEFRADEDITSVQFWGVYPDGSGCWVLPIWSDPGY